MGFGPRRQRGTFPLGLTWQHENTGMRLMGQERDDARPPAQGSRRGGMLVPMRHTIDPGSLRFCDMLHLGELVDSLVLLGLVQGGCQEIGGGGLMCRFKRLTIEPHEPVTQGACLAVGGMS